MILEKALEVCSLLILAGAIAIVGARRMHTVVSLYAFQSLTLGVVAALVAYHLEEPHIYVVAFLTVAIKAIAIPSVIHYVMRQIEIRREVESFLGVPSSLLVAALLVAMAYYAAYSTLGLGLDAVPQLLSSLLGVSLANVLIGFFLMINRRKAISQAVGLSVMENGLFLAAIALTSGMPLVIEFGVFFELLIGAMLMGILIFKIKESINSINTDELSYLKD